MEDHLLIGSQLGKYEIRGDIGRGGMGSVYLGHDPQLDRQVAIKVLAPHLVWDREFIERFMREARSAARLKHPHIVTIHDVGQEASSHYFVMEYLPGESLADILRRQEALPTDEVLGILRALASALDYAHYRGIVHRDVKPGNVIISPEGQVTLMDFGIARAGGMHRLTSTGTIVGTPEYMAPEQARGTGADARSDQYSLAVMAYQMLSGQVPFQADSSLALMYQVVHEPPPPLGQLRPDLPLEVEQVIERALAKEPGARYENATTFVEALAQALAGDSFKAPVAAAGVTAPPMASGGAPDPRAIPTAKPAPVGGGNVPRWIWALGGAAVLTLAGGGFLALLEGGLGETKLTPPAREAAVAALPEKAEATAMPSPSPSPAPSLTTGPTGGGAYVTETATFTPLPSPSATVTSRPTSTKTATRNPTRTPTPSPSPTPTRTPRPSPTPTATIDADPAVYDNFNNPAHDGSFNQSQWTYWSDPPNQIAQQDGILTATQDGDSEDARLAARRYLDFALSKPTFFEARLMLSPDQHVGNVQLHVHADFPSGEWWFSECHVDHWSDQTVWATCFDTAWPWQEAHDFWAEGKPVDLGTWHLFRIEVDPATMTFTYYIDGQMVGSHVPVDADNLKKARFTMSVGVCCGPSSEALTGYIDDVRISQ